MIKYSLRLVILGALAFGLFSYAGCDKWKFIVTTTGIKLPAGGVVSVVEHPTEVVYCGTIDLKSDAAVKAFVSSNGFTPMSSHVESDGFVHQGTLVYDVPKEMYSDTYVLFGHSKLYAWEFVLDSMTRRVRYELLAPDFAGDLPYGTEETQTTTKK